MSAITGRPAVAANDVLAALRAWRDAGAGPDVPATLSLMQHREADADARVLYTLGLALAALPLGAPARREALAWLIDRAEGASGP